MSARSTTLPILFALAAMTGCSGGSSIAPFGALPQVTYPTAINAAKRSILSGRVGNERFVQTGDGARFLYVGNTANNTITVYQHNATGNAVPVRVVGGSRTLLSNPGQLSEDAQGNLYVANGNPFAQSTFPAILEFSCDADGNVAPTRIIAGPTTGIHNVLAMTVDKSTGDIFVIDDAYNSANNDFASVLHFATTANGNSAPLAQSAPTLYPAVALALDSTETNFIEASQGVCCNSTGSGQNTYSTNFANNAPLNPKYSIRDLVNAGVADDPTTQSYLTTTQSGIFRLAEHTTANPAPNFDEAPISVITSDTCGTQLAVAGGRTPETYVTHSLHLSSGRCPVDAVYVYANNASGEAVPVRVLTGSSTRLNGPYGIYVGI